MMRKQLKGGSPPDALPLDDVKAIVRLLGRIAGMTEPIVERRRELVRLLSELIDADIWMWIHSRIDPATNYPTAFKILDGGWTGDSERSAFLSALHDPEINAAIIAKQVSTAHRTTLRQEVLSDHDAAEAKLLARWSQMCGMRENITTAYVLSEHAFSGMGFHRRVGKPPFTDRERCIVHVIASQIDWLHRAETDVPANTDKLLDLSPRQRVVLVHLLGGESRKRIAFRLKLSEHTIADHMKVIYKNFNVSSHPELLSLFMSGGRR